jgi:hypothetical protein
MDRFGATMKFNREVEDPASLSGVDAELLECVFKVVRFFGARLVVNETSLVPSAQIFSIVSKSWKLDDATMTIQDESRLSVCFPFPDFQEHHPEDTDPFYNALVVRVVGYEDRQTSIDYVVQTHLDADVSKFRAWKNTHADQRILELEPGVEYALYNVTWHNTFKCYQPTNFTSVHARHAVSWPDSDVVFQEVVEEQEEEIGDEDDSWL